MPELPEVETARSLIAGRALHRTIVGVDDADTYVTRPHTPGQLRDALVGRELTAVMRRGKTIWAGTSGVDGDPAPGPDLGIHLGMSGRIVITAPGGEAAEGGGPRRRDAQPRKREWDRFTIEFADGGRLALFDKRRLGRVRLARGRSRSRPGSWISPGSPESGTCWPTRRSGRPGSPRPGRSAASARPRWTGSTRPCRPR